VYAKRDASNNLAFGIEKFNGGATYSGFNYSLSTLYLLVAKYTFNGNSQDDAATLFVFTDPTLPSTEPATATIGPITESNADASTISNVALRQGSASSSPTVIIDGIRVANAWSQAPLPIELLSFNAQLNNQSVHLAWSTTTETNNYGFEIERQTDGSTVWQPIGFVNGHGTSNSPHEYVYEDVLTGAMMNVSTLTYRLRQIDRDGDFEYSPVVSVSRQLEMRTTLHAGYPNPFSSTLLLSFTLARENRVTLTLTNTLGVVVRKIHDGDLLPAGSYRSTAEVGDVLPGMYCATLTTDGISISQTLLKLQ